MTEQEQETALLKGKLARWAYFVILEAITFFSMVSISPSWMGVFDTHFLGPCLSTMLLNSIPFLIPSSDRALLAGQLAESERHRVSLLDQIKTYEGVIRDKRDEGNP